MTDFEVLQTKSVSEIVDFAFNKYKPYIYKRSLVCYKISKYQYLTKDFIQEVYVQLFYFIEKIKIDKIVDVNKFDFYIFVYYSTCRIFKSLNLNKKYYINENNIDYFNYMSDLMLYDKMKSVLTKRQNIILTHKMNNVHEKQILKKLNISHATYNFEMQIIKSIFNKFNY